MLALESCRRYTLDDEVIRAVAKQDPRSFVKHSAGETLVIDEVQKVPELLEAIKIVIDNDNSRGQYLLTGSSDLQFAKAERDSLAERLGKVRLRPLAYGEMRGNGPDFLDKAFSGNLKHAYEDVDKRGIIVLAITGGYLEPRTFSSGALYLFDCVPAWAKSDYALLGRRPKWIVGDTGLMAGLLGWNAEEVYFAMGRSLVSR